MSAETFKMLMHSTLNVELFKMSKYHLIYTSIEGEGFKSQYFKVVLIAQLSFPPYSNVFTDWS